MGFSSTMGRIGSICSPFLMSIGSYQRCRWIPDVVLGAACLVASVLAISLMDTTNMPLRDTIQDAEFAIEQQGSRR